MRYLFVILAFLVVAGSVDALPEDIDTKAPKLSFSIFGLHGNSVNSHLTRTESSWDTERQPGMSLAFSMWKKHQILGPVDLKWIFVPPIHLGGRISYNHFQVTTPIEHYAGPNNYYTDDHQNTADQLCLNFLIGSWVNLKGTNFSIGTAWLAPGIELNQEGRSEFYLIQNLSVIWKKVMIEIGWGNNFGHQSSFNSTNDTNYWFGLGYVIH